MSYNPSADLARLYSEDNPDMCRCTFSSGAASGRVIWVQFGQMFGDPMSDPAYGGVGVDVSGSKLGFCAHGIDLAGVAREDRLGIAANEALGVTGGDYEIHDLIDLGPGQKLALLHEAEA